MRQQVNNSNCLKGEALEDCDFDFKVFSSKDVSNLIRRSLFHVHLHCAFSHVNKKVAVRFSLQNKLQKKRREESEIRGIFISSSGVKTVHSEIDNCDVNLHTCLEEVWLNLEESAPSSGERDICDHRERSEIPTTKREHVAVDREIERERERGKCATNQATRHSLHSTLTTFNIGERMPSVDVVRSTCKVKQRFHKISRKCGRQQPMRTSRVVHETE